MNDRIVVKMFAGARERVGAESIEIVLSMPASVLQLKQAMTAQFADLESLVEYGRIAINNEFVEDAYLIPQSLVHSEIALIPPVSGG